jgi:methyl-accepting chemotaxis protein
MEGDLSARIPVRGTHDEIDQLVASLNAMLARIQQLMDGLRQVSSQPSLCIARQCFFTPM